jgi:hypothetical protein
MKTLTEKYEALKLAVRLRITCKILDKGEESRHRSDTVLKIRKDEYQFNLEGNRYLTEITPTELIDNEGYAYNHSTLPIEKICEAVDNA